MTKLNLQEVSLLVFTRDCAERLEPLIESTSWIKNRIAVDMRSQDQTVERLLEAGFKVHTIEQELFVDEIRNKNLGIVKTHWTLILDSDEFLADDSQEQVEMLIASADIGVVGYSIPRHNYFLDKKLMGPGWYPDHQIRLFRTNQIVYSPGHHVPPRPIIQSQIIKELDAPSCLHIHHNNYPSIEEFLSRQLHYALTDTYDQDPNSFNFDDYILKAIAQFNLRYEGRTDGELSYVTALTMYWDQIVRGLIHWEKTGHKGTLTEQIPNQVTLDNELSRLNREIYTLRQELVHHQGYTKSLSWKLTAPLRTIYSFLRVVLRLKN